MNINRWYENGLRAATAGVVALIAAVALFVGAVTTVRAAILYDNCFGCDGYTLSAWNITILAQPTDTIFNSFVLSTGATVDDIEVALWVLHFDDVTSSVTSVDWAILADNGGEPAFGTVIASGTANPVGTPITTFTSFGTEIDVLDEAFNIPGVPLAGGTTYWLALTNGIATSNVFWDQSDGQSTAFSGVLDKFIGGIPPCHDNSAIGGGNCTDSESFKLSGTSGSVTVPEPGTLLLLGLGAGMMGLARARRLA